MSQLEWNKFEIFFKNQLKINILDFFENFSSIYKIKILKSLEDLICLPIDDYNIDNFINTINDNWNLATLIEWENKLLNKIKVLFDTYKKFDSEKIWITTLNSTKLWWTFLIIVKEWQSIETLKKIFNEILNEYSSINISYCSWRANNNIWTINIEQYIDWWIFSNYIWWTDELNNWNITLIDEIKKWENNELEFKSSLRWDCKENRINSNLEMSVCKTIIAFLNSWWWVLLIWINNYWETIWIENDYQTFNDKSKDWFLKHFDNLINFNIWKEFHKFINLNIINIDFKDVCIVKIKKSSIPVFLKINWKDEFYIRASASSQPLWLKEALNYINLNFN